MSGSGKSTKVSTVYIVITIIIVSFLIIWKNRTVDWKKYSDKPLFVVDQDGKEEYCITCHQDMKNAGNSHPFSSFGCTVCHKGEGGTLDFKLAHQGLVKNPAALENASSSCGNAECHPSRVSQVKKSIMETNTGIISGLYYQWGITASPNISLATKNISDSSKSFNKITDKNIADLQFRKFCSTCHVDKEKGDFKGEIGRRGGGCIDCHYSRNGKEHPKFTTNIPTERCALCHNRSARIGLSYRGIWEDDNYRVPYSNGEQKDNLLSSHRSWQKLVPDIHFEAGMECIDCHTYKGTMGDGVLHHHMESQVDISCESCHGNGKTPPKEKKISSDDIEIRLARENGYIKLKTGDVVAATERGTGIYNLQKIDGNWVYFRKSDGKRVKMKIIQGKPYHNFKGHERLACSSCHSSWMPQCYGCHDKFTLQSKQTDKISHKKTAGKWSEKADYYRFESPIIGKDANGKIAPVSPGCQVKFSSFNKDGKKVASHSHLGMSTFNPHTVRKEVVSCSQCHLDRRKLGLGDVDSDTERTWNNDNNYSLYRLVGKDGKFLQRFARKKAGSFSKDEIEKILFVGKCIICHDSYSDKIYGNFKKSKEYFYKNNCPK